MFNGKFQRPRDPVGPGRQVSSQISVSQKPCIPGEQYPEFGPAHICEDSFLQKVAFGQKLVQKDFVETFE